MTITIVFLTLDNPWTIQPGASCGYIWHPPRPGSIAGVRGVPKACDVMSMKLGTLELVPHGTILRIVSDRGFAFPLQGSDIYPGMQVSIVLRNPTPEPITPGELCLEVLEDDAEPSTSSRNDA